MDQLNPTITQTLRRLNADCSHIENRTLKYLQDIENTFTEIFNKQAELQQAIKDNKPTISHISSKSKISRQTLYNIPLLKDYIELRIKDYRTSDTSDKNSRLSTRLNELNSIIEQMQIRDVSIELLKHKVSLLEDELKRKSKENLELRKQYENSLARNTNKYAQSNSSTKVLDFNKNNLV